MQLLRGLTSKMLSLCIQAMTSHARLIWNRLIQSSFRMLDESRVLYKSNVLELCLQAACEVFVCATCVTHLYVDEGTGQKLENAHGDNL